jgi:hypothetical protein
MGLFFPSTFTASKQVCCRDGAQGFCFQAYTPTATIQHSESTSQSRHKRLRTNRNPQPCGRHLQDGRHMLSECLLPRPGLVVSVDDDPQPFRRRRAAANLINFDPPTNAGLKG